MAGLFSDPGRSTTGWRLRAGHKLVAAASGPLAEEGTVPSSHASDADLHAMAVYIKGPRQSDTATALAAGNAKLQAVASIYADGRPACHAPHGWGVANLSRHCPALRHHLYPQQPGKAAASVDAGTVANQRQKLNVNARQNRD